MKSARKTAVKSILAVAACYAGLSTTVCRAQAESPPGAGVEKWFAEMGVFWRSVGDVDFGLKSLPDLSRYQPSLPPSSAVGPATAVADREYENGYVRRDYGTGLWDNNTWYWGRYNSAVDSKAGQITFEGSTYTLRGESFSPRDEFTLGMDDGTGVQVRLGRELIARQGLRGFVILGAGYVPFDASATLRDLGQEWTVQRSRIVDGYELLPTEGLPPGNPNYRGTKEGPGYVIPNIPAARSMGGSRTVSSTEIYHSVKQDLDVDLWVLSLGAEVQGAIHERVLLTAGAGLSGNLISADSQFHWAATQDGKELDSMASSESDDEFEAGLYAEGGIMVQLNGRLFVAVRGRYDYLFDDPSVSFTHTDASVELNGASVSGAVGMRF